MSRPKEAVLASTFMGMLLVGVLVCMLQMCARQLDETQDATLPKRRSKSCVEIELHRVAGELYPRINPRDGRAGLVLAPGECWLFVAPYLP